jgi:hypothetical protein
MFLCSTDVQKRLLSLNIHVFPLRKLVVKMRSTNETSRRSTSERRKDNNQIEKLKDAVLLSDLPMEIRMVEASKPLFLSRYE